MRLKYLVSKYADHAPYWQFVLMARQLAVIAISVGLGAYDKPALVLAEAAATLAVLIVALVLHCRTQPYPYRSQNVLETVLASFSILAVVTASTYYAWSQRMSHATRSAEED